MSRKKESCEFVAVAECPCGRQIALCVKHGGIAHQPPQCLAFRSMERGAYIDHINRHGLKRQFEQADSDEVESWPRA